MPLMPRYTPIAYLPKLNKPAVKRAPIQTSRHESGSAGSILQMTVNGRPEALARADWCGPFELVN